MAASNILVVYYSRTGTTASLADRIARATGADVEALVDTVNRDGTLGFMRSLFHTFRRASAKLMPLHVDPSSYELVIIGTPDWGSDVSAPVRTFLTTYRGRLARVAFFLTDGVAQHDAVFKSMAALVGREPVATLGVPHDAVKADAVEGPLARFVAALPVPRPASTPAAQPA